MKKLVFVFTIAALLAACKTREPHYVIKGKIAGADSITFYLQKREAGKYVKIDSAIVVKGEFTIAGGKVEYPDMVSLVARDMRRGVSFFLENAEVTITGKLDSLYKAKITGSRSQDEYTALQKSLEPANKKYSDLYMVYQEAGRAGNKAKTDSLEKQFDTLQKEMSSIEKDFVKNNPKSYVSPTIIRSLSYEMEPAEIEGLLIVLDTNVAKTQLVKDLQARVAIMKTVAKGQKAPDFTLNDPDDKPVSLYSKVGKTKLLLVDFWASWCGPCRQENPNVVKVWKEFNKKGFDIFSVSLDRPGDKEKWLGAIKNDKLTWTHVSDLKFWECAAAKQYAVNAIPANFLLDENGIILEKNLRGEDLYNKIKELLSKK
ncbi:MAG: TlpA disulfide reductase family protein [Bacteroidales bacterium]|jgi:peroxiredoxin